MEYRRRIGGPLLSGTALLCLALGSCNKAPQANQPITGAPIAAMQLATTAPPPQTYAPPASALPPAPRPVAYRPAPQHWRYLNDAYDMSDAFADTPPDYTVAYDGEDPYVWRADDGAYRVVEWMPEGARYYYYEPGADEPFLIQDPEYSYAYDNGVLVAVYTLAGALVADRIAAERAGYAARYYARGHDLYRAAQQERRQPAYADNWRERAPMVQAQRARWQQGRQDQPGWQDWNRAHQAQQEQRWAPERQHRAAYAAALSAASPAAAAHPHERPAQTAEARPAPLPATQYRPGPFPNGNRPDLAARRGEADRAQPGLLHGSIRPPQAHVQEPATAERHGQDMSPPERARPQAAQPGVPEEHGRQDHGAARQAMAQAEQAQRHGVQDAQRAQQRQAQQAERAQHQAERQAAQAQRTEIHAQQQQAQRAQRQEAQQVAQAQRTEIHAQQQQAQHAQQAAAQAQHAQMRAEAHAAPPHAEPPRPQPQHAASSPQAPHSAAQQHNTGDEGDKQRDHHH